VKSLLLACVLAVLLPGVATADGKVLVATALAEQAAQIPDQRALVHFDQGMERLVIEARFQGPGTQFAWVIPLPSKPEIEEVSQGLFPTLEYLFQPEISDRPGRWWLAGLGIPSFGYLVVTMKRGAWPSLKQWAAVGVVSGCLFAAYPPMRLMVSVLLALGIVLVATSREPVTLPKECGVRSGNSWIRSGEKAGCSKTIFQGD